MTPSPEVQDLITAFETLLMDWFEQARPGVPTFVLPDVKTVKPGLCISCGVAVESGRWRCAACVSAIECVLKEFGS